MAMQMVHDWIAEQALLDPGRRDRALQRPHEAPPPSTGISAWRDDEQLLLTPRAAPPPRNGSPRRPNALPALVAPGSSTANRQKREQSLQALQERWRERIARQPIHSRVQKRPQPPAADPHSMLWLQQQRSGSPVFPALRAPGRPRRRQLRCLARCADDALVCTEGLAVIAQCQLSLVRTGSCERHASLPPLTSAFRGRGIPLILKHSPGGKLPGLRPTLVAVGMRPAPAAVADPDAAGDADPFEGAAAAQHGTP
eukprot:TRINITY_DN7821_c0_g1_i2.p1 TRINITY_DN7821_c0_g1~~TRINITY_DN7821_c0_g1_i2.p1  ORF type:complete len:255 (+),score=49.07 TRINITY_DN7821_c0_g1_i2:135-899(+)